MTIRVTKGFPPYCMPLELITDFQPAPEDIRTVFKNGDHERKITNNIELDQAELESIASIRRLQEKLDIKLSASLDSRILRYLSHARGNSERALEALIRSQDWRKEFFTPMISDEELLRVLDRGFIYFSGRDSGFRPILVLRAHVAFQRQDEVEKDVFARAMAFCMEFALRYLFIPGKAETVVAIIDLQGVGISQLRDPTMKLIGQMMTQQYIGRLYQMYIVNQPMFMHTLWSVAKTLLSDRQVSKIVFTKAADVAKGRCALHQLEEQYGGTAKPLTTFYPFYFPPGPFEANGMTGPNLKAQANCHKFMTRETSRGKLAEIGVGVQPLKWSRLGVHYLSKLGVKMQPDVRRFVSLDTMFGEDELGEYMSISSASIYGDLRKTALSRAPSKTSRAKPSKYNDEVQEKMSNIGERSEADIASAKDAADDQGSMGDLRRTTQNPTRDDDHDGDKKEKHQKEGPAAGEQLWRSRETETTGCETGDSRLGVDAHKEDRESSILPAPPAPSTSDDARETREVPAGDVADLDADVDVEFSPMERMGSSTTDADLGLVGRGSSGLLEQVNGINLDADGGEGYEEDGGEEVSEMSEGTHVELHTEQVLTRLHQEMDRKRSERTWFHCWCCSNIPDSQELVVKLSPRLSSKGTL